MAIQSPIRNRLIRVWREAAVLFTDASRRIPIPVDAIAAITTIVAAMHTNMDGLVPVQSAVGQHHDPRLELSWPFVDLAGAFRRPHASGKSCFRRLALP